MWNARARPAAGALPHGRLRRAGRGRVEPPARERRVRLRAARRRPAGGRGRGRAGSAGPSRRSRLGRAPGLGVRDPAAVSRGGSRRSRRSRPRPWIRWRSAERSCCERGQVLRWLARLRRSWYIVVAADAGDADAGVARSCGRGIGGGGCCATSSGSPPATTIRGPTLADDGIDGAKLYRRNMPRRALRPRATRSRTCPCSWWSRPATASSRRTTTSLAERYAPRLRRRIVGSGHWAPRAQPERIARWIEQFVDEVEAGTDLEAPRAALGARRRESSSSATGWRSSPAPRAGSARRPRASWRRTAPGCCSSTATATAPQRVAASRSAARTHSPATSRTRRRWSGSRTPVLGEHGVPQIVVNNAGIGIAGALSGHRLRGVAPDRVDQPDGGGLRLAAVRARDARAGGGGTDRQHRLGGGVRAEPRAAGLLDDQGRGPDAERVPARRARAVGDRRDRGVPRVRGDQHHPHDAVGGARGG